MDIVSYANTNHIAISCDATQRPGLFALVNSILINSKSNISFHLLVETRQELIMIQQQLNILFDYQLARRQITFEIKSLDAYSKIYLFIKKNYRQPDKGHGEHCHSVMTYARLFLPEIFTDVEKAAYVDIDTIFKVDIEPLFSYDTKNTMMWIAFLNDSSYTIQKMINNDSEALEYFGILNEWNNNIQGFNCGIYLLNFTTWRKHKVINKCKDIMMYNKNHTRNVINAGDQSILNIIFNSESIINHTRIGYFDKKWNVLDLGWKMMNGSIIDKAYVLHWNGKNKPWSKCLRLNHRLWFDFIPKKFNAESITNWSSDWISYEESLIEEEWHINWQLLDKFKNDNAYRRYRSYLQQRIQMHDLDVSNIISWNTPSNNILAMYCGSQYYDDTLSVPRNINPKKAKKLINKYLQVHDIVLNTDQKTIWIFFINYGCKRNTNACFTNKHYNRFMNKHQYLICSFNDGTSFISHKIITSQKWFWYSAVECDIPSHLISDVLNADQYTNISVSIIDPMFLQPNHYVSFIKLPICSKWKINNFDHINLNLNLNLKKTMWNSQIYDTYKYNIIACAIIHPIQMEYNSLHYGKHDQAAFILRDWIEYNLGILGVQHLILYQHFYPDEIMKNMRMQQLTIFNVLQSYIKLGKITYIPWYNEYMGKRRTFHYSMINSALKRFGHTKFAKYIMFLDIDEYIVATSEYQHLDLSQLIHNLNLYNKQHITSFQLECHKSFTCDMHTMDMRCSINKTFETVFERHSCIAGNDNSGNRLTKQIIQALKVKLMYTHFVDIFIGENNNNTKILNNTLCVHAKSNILIINHGIETFSNIHSNKHVNNMIYKFRDYMKYNSTTKQQTKLLPLYRNTSSYCGNL